MTLHLPHTTSTTPTTLQPKTLQHATPHTQNTTPTPRRKALPVSYPVRGTNKYFSLSVCGCSAGNCNRPLAPLLKKMVAQRDDDTCSAKGR